MFDLAKAGLAATAIAEDATIKKDAKGAREVRI